MTPFEIVAANRDAVLQHHAIQRTHHLDPVVMVADPGDALGASLIRKALDAGKLPPTHGPSQCMIVGSNAAGILAHLPVPGLADALASRCTMARALPGAVVVVVVSGGEITTTVGVHEGPAGSAELN